MFFNFSYVVKVWETSLYIFPFPLIVVDTKHHPKGFFVESSMNFLLRQKLLNPSQKDFNKNDHHKNVFPVNAIEISLKKLCNCPLIPSRWHDGKSWWGFESFGEVFVIVIKFRKYFMVVLKKSSEIQNF